jgi:hypothetical protein
MHAAQAARAGNVHGRLDHQPQRALPARNTDRTTHACRPPPPGWLLHARASARPGVGAVPAVRALPQPTTRRTQPQSARATTDAREPAGELAGAGGTLLNCRLQPADVRRRSRRLAGPGRGPRPRAACSVLHVNAAVQ